MDVKNGVANVAREVTLDSELTGLEVEAAMNTALQSGSALRLEDARGRVVLIPASAIGYLDIGETAKGRVGFST